MRNYIFPGKVNFEGSLNDLEPWERGETEERQRDRQGYGIISVIKEGKG